MDENVQPKKKNLWVYIVVIVIVVLLAAAGYYFLIRKAAKPIVWDGTYKMVGTLTCKGNIPGLTTVPMTSTIVVSNNIITDQGVKETFAIDKNGKAAEIFQQTANGVTTDVKADYQFSEEGGAYKFTSDGSVTLSATDKNGQALSSICTGTATGAKQ